MTTNTATVQQLAAEAATWFDELHISERDRLKMGRTNAMRLFKLG